MVTMGTDIITEKPQPDWMRLSLLLWLMALPAWSAQWHANGAFTFGLEYTDNTNRSDTDPHSAYIGELSPRIGLTGESDRLRVQVDYSYSYRLNSSTEDRGYNLLNLSAELEPVKDRLNLFARAYINRQITDLGTILLPPDLTDDRLETVQTYSTGLDWFVPLSRVADSRLGLEYRQSSSSSSLDRTPGYQLTYAVNSGPWFQRTFWDASYQLSREQRGDDPTDRFQQARANAGVGLFADISAVANLFWEENEAFVDGELISYNSASAGPGLRWTPSPKTTLQATYNFDLTSDAEQPEEDYWSIYAKWQPTVRTGLEAEYGQRFYGDYYQANISHSARKLRNQLSYNESLYTYGRQLATTGTTLGLLICPVGSAITLDQCSLLDPRNPVIPPGMQLVGLEIPYSNIIDDPFIDRTGIWSTSYISGRQILSLNLTYSEREFLNNNPSEQDREKDYGGLLSWSWSMGPRTSAQISYNRRWLIPEGGARSNDTRYQLALYRNLSRSLTGNLSVSRTERNSQTEPYDENRLRLAFTFTL